MTRSTQTTHNSLFFTTKQSNKPTVSRWMMRCIGEWINRHDQSVLRTTPQLHARRITSEERPHLACRLERASFPAGVVQTRVHNKTTTRSACTHKTSDDAITLTTRLRACKIISNCARVDPPDLRLRETSTVATHPVSELKRKT